MTRKLVDPVHFFNERGCSVISEAEYLARIDELSAELEEEKRKNKLLVTRLQSLSKEKQIQAN